MAVSCYTLISCRKCTANFTIAIILGSDTLRHYLINYARPLIYTTFLSYPALALVRSSYKLLQSGQTVVLQENLHNLTRTLFQCLLGLYGTSTAVRSLLKIPHACPESPIFAIQVQRPRHLANMLQSRGMMVRPVVPPTVPLGTERVRVCLHAGNTVAEIQRLVDALEEWCDSRLSELMENHKPQAMHMAKL
jgi:8-amino-7-oxononanoate synthase